MTLAAPQLSLSAPAWSAFVPDCPTRTAVHHPGLWGALAECRAVDSSQLAELEVRGPMPAGERGHSAVQGVHQQRVPVAALLNAWLYAARIYRPDGRFAAG